MLYPMKHMIYIYIYIYINYKNINIKQYHHVNIYREISQTNNTNNINMGRYK